jgi:alkylhydroperoxidase family enzyme
VGEGHAGCTERPRVDLLGDGNGGGHEVEAEERDAVAQRWVRARCSSDCFVHGNGGARR